MQEPIILVEGLEKTYPDGTQAVKGISFEVRKGEIFGLLGPNGAGKTTTMRILGTLNRRTGGTARILGHDVETDAKALRHRMGFAMQEVGMDELATAKEMLHFHGALLGLPKRVVRERAQKLLETFDLEKHANRRVSRFSGGMQRRLDLAVSLIHEPDVLFLDEPSTGLDPKSRSDLWNILRRLRKEHGLTVVLSTHYMEEADELCDRIAIVAQGEIATIGTPKQLKEQVGADRILVDLLKEPTGDQLQQLQRTFGPDNLELEGPRVTVLVRNGPKLLMPALTKIHAVGLAIGSVEVRQPTLDDAFLQFTGQRLEVEA